MRQGLVRTAIVLSIALPIVLVGAGAEAAGDTPGHKDCERVKAMSWDAILEEAKGQEVNIWLWAGDPSVNQYIDEWVGSKAEKLFSIKVGRVAIKDTVEGVMQVVSEKTAGRHTGGSVDVNWISGENLRTLIQGDMLCTGYRDKLPNAKYINFDDPIVAFHGSMEVGQSSIGWGRSHHVFVYNTANILNLPTSWA